MAARIAFSGQWVPVGDVEGLLRVLNHPGHADQSSHGRKGMRKISTLKATYERVDEQTGLRTKVEGTSVNKKDESLAGEVDYRPGWMTVEISVTNREGEDIGGAFFEVSPDGKTVHHSEMLLESEFQGQGFATRQMLHVLDSYKKNGVERMTLTANSDVGGYAWARAGFKFDSPNERGKLAQAATMPARLRKYDAATRAEIKRVARNPDASPADFAMIGHTAGATTWPGKEIMLNSTWGAVMDL